MSQAERPTEVFDPESFEQPVGESPDGYTQGVLGLCHQVINKFPELTDYFRSHRGRSIVSGSLVISTGIAISARMRNGHSPQRILEQITATEILKAPKLEMDYLRKRFQGFASKVRRQIERAKRH